jgi:histone deacetylase 11
MVPLVYHPKYNITAFGFEKLHPFDGQKYKRIHAALIARGLRQAGDFIRPRPAKQADLLRLHTCGYLRSLRRVDVLARILEVPQVRRFPAWVINWRILRPMRYATGGTALACRLALEHGVAINLGGGYHHASADHGGGFCVYADVPLAVKTLHDEGKIAAVLVVDLDAHQGNGTAAVFRGWSWAKILDLYQADIYPVPKEPEDFPLAVGPGLTGSDYIEMVEDALIDALETVRPDLVVYNAGSDPFIDDPLASFRLAKSELVERDLLVVSLVRERSIPLAMVLSGGYSGQSWRIHADAIEDILVRFDKGLD